MEYQMTYHKTSSKKTEQKKSVLPDKQTFWIATRQVLTSTGFKQFHLFHEKDTAVALTGVVQSHFEGM